MKIDIKMVVIIILLVSLSFVAGAMLEGRIRENREPIIKTAEQIILQLPTTRADLERQYLLNKAQHSILEQMLKWDLFKSEDSIDKTISKKGGK